MDREAVFRDVVSRISFSGLMGPHGADVRLAARRCPKGFLWLDTSMTVPDRVTGEAFRLGSTTGLPRDVGPEPAEVTRWVWRAVRSFWEHEALEGFRVDGRLYLNPHPGHPS